MKNLLSYQTSIIILKVLLFAKATIWFLFALVGYSGSLITRSMPYTIILILVVVMVVDGLLYLFFGLIIRNASKRIIILASVFTGVNFLLAFTDQIGWVDIAVASVDLIILLLLFATLRYVQIKNYTEKNTRASSREE